MGAVTFDPALADEIRVWAANPIPVFFVIHLDHGPRVILFRDEVARCPTNAQLMALLHQRAEVALEEKARGGR